MVDKQSIVYDIGFAILAFNSVVGPLLKHLKKCSTEKISLELSELKST